MWIIFTNCREARELCLFYLKTIALFIFIFHNVITHSKTHELGGGKGSHCKTDNDCDQSRFLDCVGAGRTCDCNKAYWLTWVPEEDSCMLMEEYPCGRKANGPKCITNSSCIAERCVCDDDFLRDGFGTCDLSYGKTCSLNEPEKCAKRYSLKCTDLGRNKKPECRCMNEGTELVWHEEKSRCVSTAGGACDLPDSPRYGKDDQIECIDSAQCMGTGERGFCKCKPGSSEVNFSCMLQFGEVCGVSKEFEALSCNRYQFLVCNEGKCGCQFYGQMKFDNNTKQCRLLAGESCDVSYTEHREHFNATTKRKPICVADSTCDPFYSGSQRGSCKCNPGMSPLADGTCSRYNKGHGFPCSTSIDCNKDKSLICVNNEMEGSRCDCQSEMYYDGKDCRVLAGRNCTINTLCANNSYCEGTWCVCKEGFKIDSMGCIPEPRINDHNTTLLEIAWSHGQINPEEEESSCNDFFQGSEEWTRCHHCQEKIDSHTWIQNGSAADCMALVGTGCLLDDECVPNAICDADVNICQCSTGTHTTKYKTCFISPGSSKQHERTETHTLQSIRSQETYDNAAKAQNIDVVVVFGAILLQYFVCN